MNIRRFKDQNIPTSVNALDRTNIPLSESLTREGILYTYESVYPIQDPSHNLTFELDVIDTEDDREDTYEQANSLSNNEVINQLDNLRTPQREIFHPHIFDPRRVTASNWKSDMVENMANIVTEYKIIQGDFQ